MTVRREVPDANPPEGRQCCPACGGDGYVTDGGCPACNGCGHVPVPDTADRAAHPERYLEGRDYAETQCP